MIDNKWQAEHSIVIDEFLKFVNTITQGYILKGGTALMKCYGLNRFSEDIDFDSIDAGSIEDIVQRFCVDKGYIYRKSKDTDTVKRFFIHYEKEKNRAYIKPLKVEISYRRKSINKDHVQKIKGINVYDINSLCIMKTIAFSNRDKIRDLYDLVFICNNYLETLREDVKEGIRNSFEYKGFKHFDYLINTQTDVLINSNQLVENYLLAYDKLGLLEEKAENREKLPQIEPKKEAKLNKEKVSLLKEWNKEKDK